jgi:hypothetical protein
MVKECKELKLSRLDRCSKTTANSRVLQVVGEKYLNDTVNPHMAPQNPTKPHGMCANVTR